jgi:hypothetical protein
VTDKNIASSYLGMILDIVGSEKSGAILLTDLFDKPQNIG